MTSDTTRKPPILLLHSLGGTDETLAPLARALESFGHRIAHPTLAEQDRLRNTSEGSPLKSTLLDLLDEATGHARHLAEEHGKPIVCGHSNGALLASVLAAEGISSHLVLLAPVPPPSVSSGVPCWLQRLFFRISFGRDWASGVLHFERQRRFDPDPPPPAVARTLLPDSGRVLFDAITLTCGGRFDPELSEKAAVTVIAGDWDKIVSLATAKRVAARHGANLHVVRNGGHWFPAEAQFADVVAGYILRDVADRTQRHSL